MPAPKEMTMTTREIAIVAVIIGTMIAQGISDTEAAKMGGLILRELRNRDLLKE